MNMQAGEYQSRAKVEISEFVNPRTVEAAYARVLQEQMKHDNALARAAFRIANDKGSSAQSKMLTALNGGAEVLHKMAEEQIGRTSRDASRGAAERVWSTEAQFFREALVTLEKQEPREGYVWIYAAAGILAGVL